MCGLTERDFALPVCAPPHPRGVSGQRGLSPQKVAVLLGFSNPQKFSKKLCFMLETVFHSCDSCAILAVVLWQTADAFKLDRPRNVIKRMEKENVCNGKRQRNTINRSVAFCLILRYCYDICIRDENRINIILYL